MSKIEPKLSMNSITPRIFIAATRMNDGKTTTSLGLLAALRNRFPRIGYIKPVGQRFVEVEELKIDEDSVLMDHFYQLDCPLEAMSPIAVEPDFTRKYLEHGRVDSLVQKIQGAFDRVAWEKDFVIAEGTGHAGVGSVFDLSNAQVAKILGSKVILITRGGIGAPIDEVTLNQALFEKHGVEMVGVIINKVIPEKLDMIRGFVERGLKRKGIRLLGCIPHTGMLSTPTISQIMEHIHAEALHGAEETKNRVHKIVIGSGTTQQAQDLTQPGILLITPGNAEELILKAAQKAMNSKGPGNAISGIIITENIHPAEKVMETIRRTRIPVLLTGGDSYTVAAQVHDMYVKTQLTDSDKVDLIRKLIQKYVDVDGIVQAVT